MAGSAKTNDGAAQGAAPIENQAGIQSELEVGAKGLVAETPEWVQAILDSNGAVLESNAAVIASNEALAEQNQSVIDSLDSFKEHSAEFAKQIVEQATASVSLGSGESVQSATQTIDEDADYEVAPGKSFADKADFAKKYKEGDDVTHLGAERLQFLLDQGLILKS